MAFLDGHCPQCSSPIKLAVGQNVQNGRVEWFRSYQCLACNIQIEEDGFDSTPEEIREALLNEQGKWAIVVRTIDHQVAMAMKAIRSSMKLSLTEIAELRSRIPGEIAYGTKAEIHRLTMLLHSAGLECQAIRKT